AVIHIEAENVSTSLQARVRLKFMDGIIQAGYCPSRGAFARQSRDFGISIEDARVGGDASTRAVVGVQDVKHIKTPVGVGGRKVDQVRKRQIGQRVDVKAIQLNFRT